MKSSVFFASIKNPFITLPSILLPPLGGICNPVATSIRIYNPQENASQMLILNAAGL